MIWPVGLLACSEYDLRPVAEAPPTTPDLEPTVPTPTLTDGVLPTEPPVDRETGHTGLAESGTQLHTGTQHHTGLPPDTCVPESWRDSWPPPPAPALLPPNLAPAGPVALGTCVGAATTTTDPAGSETFDAPLAHATGKWYFEVATLAHSPGWSRVGVAAWPSSVRSLGFALVPVSEVSESPAGLGTWSFAVDADAGEVTVYADGVRTRTVGVPLYPQLGAFHAGGSSTVGNSLRFSFGADAFTYAPPAGFLPWNGGAAAAGVCVSDVDPPIHTAPVVVRRVTEVDPVTSWVSGAQGVEQLVVLGARQGEVPVPGVEVIVNRTEPMVLVLAAYDRTTWTVTLAPGAQVSKVYAYGTYPPTVTGLPPGTPIELHAKCSGGDVESGCLFPTGEDFPEVAGQWPYSTGGGDTQGFVEHVEALTCLPLHTFAGGGDVDRFELN